MKIIIRIFVALALFTVMSTTTYAATKTVTVDAAGFGSTQDNAIRSALTSAVSQVNGVSLSSREITANTAVTASKTNIIGETESAEININSELSASTATKGQVHSYDILELHQQDDGTYKVNLSVKVYHYDVPTSSNRKRLAILSPKTSTTSYSLFGNLRASGVSDYVGGLLEQEIVQTRKFSVLSRSDLDDISSELALISSDSTSPEEKAKLGRLLGADYLLIPSITKASGSTTSEKIKVTGQTKTTSYGVVEIAIKVVVPATGEIKFSDTYSATTSRPIGAKLFDYAVSKAVKDLIDRIYPLLIVKASGSNYVINGGGDSVKVGQFFEVYKKGESIVDPYTGESLGENESWAGQIKVTRVDPKMSHASISKGGPISIGMVLRPSKAQSYVAPAKRPEAKADAGFRLPFE
jgi:curli biogenesis system outer membrane secretion channel CsgG